jgi:hypothetical protein
MADERDPSTLHKLLGHYAHEFHYSKVDIIGIISTRSVKLSSWGSHLKCAGLATNWIAFN